jgi:hypothetical protein
MVISPLTGEKISRTFVSGWPDERLSSDDLSSAMQNAGDVVFDRRENPHVGTGCGRKAVARRSVSALEATPSAAQDADPSNRDGDTRFKLK